MAKIVRVAGPAPSDFQTSAGFRQYDGKAPRDLNDTAFYHTIELPSYGLMKGHWDLRGCEDSYLGHYKFSGKSVLDCGVASGFNAFEMERRGATVIGLDLDETRDPTMGLIPYYDFESRFGMTMDQAAEHRRVHQKRLRNSFLLARSALHSKVRLMVGNIMTDQIGIPPVDAAFFGCILLHLSNPLAAIYNVASRVREAIIITETMDVPNPSLDEAPVLLWRPTLGQGATNPGTWWYPYPSCLAAVLRIVGFMEFELRHGFIREEPNRNSVPIFNLTARRKS